VAEILVPPIVLICPRIQYSSVPESKIRLVAWYWTIFKHD